LQILIVDDDTDILLLLSRMLHKWGYEVLTASDGSEAWSILRHGSVNFVISDWMMPVMDGIELCRRVRRERFNRYIYFVLLTAKDEKYDLVLGMEAGADDFVVKPFNKDELNVRIRAGERVLRLERDLAQQNERLTEAYSLIRRDLETAARMQLSLLPGASMKISDFLFEWLFVPCSFVAGDIFNFFPLDEDHIGFYMLDVAGHGVSAAMLSVSLSRILTPSAQAADFLKQYVPAPPHYVITPPARVLSELNRRFVKESDAMQHFTMIYGVIDTTAHRLVLSQAGHPSPIFLRRGEKASVVGDGGYPVGMMPDIRYEEEVIELKSGDRLCIYSDGVTDCFSSDQRQFSQEKLVAYLERRRHLPLRQILPDLKATLDQWTGGRDFQDDVTLLAIQRE